MKPTYKTKTVNNRKYVKQFIIFHDSLYYGENKLHFDEMIISALYWTRLGGFL